MRHPRAAALIGVAFLAGGCRLDLTGIARTSQQAQLSLLLTAERGLPLTLTAIFQSGSGTDGKPRPLDDDALQLDGVPVRPDSAGDGYRHYTIVGLDTTASVFHIRAPSVTGVPETPPEVAVSPIRIVAPDTVVTRRPGTVELRIAGIEAEIQGLVQGHWSLGVYADTGQTEVVHISGRAPPDSLLTIPTSFLPSDLVLGRVVVQGSVMQLFDSDGGGYQSSVYRQFGGTVEFRIEG